MFLLNAFAGPDGFPEALFINMIGFKSMAALPFAWPEGVHQAFLHIRACFLIDNVLAFSGPDGSPEAFFFAQTGIFSFIGPGGHAEGPNLLPATFTGRTKLHRQPFALHYAWCLPIFFLYSVYSADYHRLSML